MKKWRVGLMVILMVVIGSACNLPFAVEHASGQVPTDTIPQATPLVETTTPVPTQVQVSADIMQLATEASMTAKAKAIFFAANPEIDNDRLLFGQHCQTQLSSNNVELGCYTSDNHIYILDIQDARLKEEMVVVAAHEMLHAAYAQLSQSERNSIDNQLETQLPLIHSVDLTQELRAYRVSEPGQRDNELHSLLGTEFAPLNPALETYYAQYFSDRDAIVNDAQDFNNVFIQLTTSLASLKKNISQTHSKMKADLASGSILSYNALVPQINSLVKQYNRTADQYNLISRELLGQEDPAASK